MDRPGHEARAEDPCRRHATAGHPPALPKRHQAAPAGRPAATAPCQVLVKNTLTLSETLPTSSHPVISPALKMLCLYLHAFTCCLIFFSFNYFIFCLVYMHILLSATTKYPNGSY